LFQYCRLPFRVAAAPAILLLKGVPNVICYIDDLLVTGETDEERTFTAFREFFSY